MATMAVWVHPHGQGPIATIVQDRRFTFSIYLSHPISIALIVGVLERAAVISMPRLVQMTPSGVPSRQHIKHIKPVSTAFLPTPDFTSMTRGTCRDQRESMSGDNYIYVVVGFVATSDGPGLDSRNVIKLTAPQVHQQHTLDHTLVYSLLFDRI